MADELIISPGQPESANFPGEFLPSQRRECEESHSAGGWGRAVPTHEYIWFGNLSQDDYPEEACSPWYHSFARVNSLFIVNSMDAENAAGITGTGGISITGSITAANITATATCSASVFSGAAKDFDIPHPNKENYRLRHGCLEGPEYGVYYRGRLTDKNTIVLPDYWDGLIDPESITVTLTQIRTSQDLIVDAIEWGKRIKVRSGNASTIDCFYTVQATRIDVLPLEVEYEGTEMKPHEI